MNERLDRAGRKAAMKKVLLRQYYRDEHKPMTVGEVARRMGLRSSTYLKNLLKEMVEEDDNILQYGDDNVFRVMFKPYIQTPFADRFFTINGQKKKVASWVADLGLMQL